MNRDRWGVYRDKDGGFHVIPHDDEADHVLDSLCECQPKMQIIASGILYTHRAYDFREVMEDLYEGILDFSQEDD